jgi:hypothetical protein
VGAILGFVSLGQIKRTGEQGRGMAIAGVVIGILSSVVAVGWFVVAFVLGLLDSGFY